MNCMDSEKRRVVHVSPDLREWTPTPPLPPKQTKTVRNAHRVYIRELLLSMTRMSSCIHLLSRSRVSSWSFSISLSIFTSLSANTWKRQEKFAYLFLWMFVCLFVYLLYPGERRLSSLCSMYLGEITRCAVKKIVRNPLWWPESSVAQKCSLGT